MKFSVPLALLSLSATSLLSVLPGVTSSVNACTVVDANTQVAIRGSRTPSQQTNDVTTGNDGNCFNSNIVSNTTQLGITSGQVVQSNQADHFVGGGDLNNTGLTTPNITVTPSTQVDVYNPALDPQFLNHLNP